MYVDIPVATPKHMDEGWHLEPDFLQKLKNSGWVSVDLEEIEEVLLGLLCQDHTSGIVWHTLGSGKVTRICMLCAMHVDHEGKPDPRFYNEEWVKKYTSASNWFKCNHRRQPRLPMVIQEGTNSHTFHYTPDVLGAPYSLSPTGLHKYAQSMSNREADYFAKDYNGPEVQDTHIAVIWELWSRTKKLLKKVVDRNS